MGLYPRVLHIPNIPDILVFLRDLHLSASSDKNVQDPRGFIGDSALISPLFFRYSSLFSNIPG